MKHLVWGDPEFVGLWHRICDEHERQKTKWIAELRISGFKAAHPNDGWVDRENKRLHFAYSHFNDGAKIGDKVMLGWPGDKPEKQRPVRLTGIDDNVWLTWFTFEDL